MHDIVAKAKEDGYVTTLFGRRRDLPELKSSNFNIRSFGERVALNTPSQGTEGPVEEAETVRKLVAEQMEHVMTLKVPLLAEAKIGESWYAAK